MAKASTLLKCSIVLAVVIATVSLTPVASEPESDSGELDLMMSVASSIMGNEKMRARAVNHALQLVAPDAHRITKRAVEVIAPHARALIPASFSLAALTLFGTFKAAVMFLGGIFFASTFLPSLFSFLGVIAPPVPFRSLTDSMKELKKLNYDMVARSIDTIQKKSYLLDIKEEACKDRAICEVGEFIGAKYPSVAFWLQNLGGFDKLLLGDQYSLAMVKGMKNQNCARLYQKCSHSPFTTWNEIVEKFR